jgi:hypothetical protein
VADRYFIHVGSGVAPLEHALKLFIGPRIQIDRLDSADVCTHTTVNTRASACLVSKSGLTHRAAAIAYRMQMKMPKFQLAHLGSVDTC